MSGNIKASSSFDLACGTLAESIANAHGFKLSPKFGGELEIMGLIRNVNGDFEPADYQSSPNAHGMSSLIQAMIEEHEFDVETAIDGKPIKLLSKSGEIICFENYAAVIERADKAYDAKTGLNDFSESIDRFADRVNKFSKKTGIQFSPFDYDTFCEKSAFEGKNAPSERFGEGGLLSFYDAQHPLVEEIDMRTTSSHFSVGYKDKEHLWRQIKIMTILTPSLYAAFAGSPPTVEVSANGIKTILPKKAANEMLEGGADIQIHRQLLVPRAQIWTLSDPDRTGIDKKIADAVFDPNASFHDYVRLIIDNNTIIYGEENSEKTFRDAFSEKSSQQQYSKKDETDDYMSHVSTFWYDIRVDLLRLEARMAGNSPWKSKALGALMTTILLNEDAMIEVENIIEQHDLKSLDVLQARQDIAEFGIKTKIGSNGQNVGDLLKSVVDVALEHIAPQSLKMLMPLNDVLEKNMPDSEFLKMIEADIKGDYSGFVDLDYNALEPFVVMHDKNMLDQIIKPKSKTAKFTCKSPQRLAI